jgi:glutathione-specific gamma-glutamylcyclotransferase
LTKYLVDSDFRPAAQGLLDLKPEGSVWLFAYGSLMWKPEIPHVELQRAVARGWHRAFSMKIERFRGTREQPGYMMCLDHGGFCEGVVLRLSDEDIEAQIEKLLRREISRQGGLEAVRWIKVDTDAGTISALAFYAAPKSLEYYSEGRPLSEVASGLARACGHWGSGAEYLYNTVSHLEELGIHDKGLWELQEIVAREIITLNPTLRA